MFTKESSSSTSPLPPLTQQQISTYLRTGILVVDNLINAEEILEAQKGLARTLHQEYGVDVHDLEGTGCGLMDASSTNGAGESLCIVMISSKIILGSQFLIPLVLSLIHIEILMQLFS